MDIREIAKRARVSAATVSRTINRVPTVDPQLSRRVWKVIEEFGFHPNTQARALVSGRSRIFGLLVPAITNPFFPEIIQVFGELAVEHGYEVLLTSTNHDARRVEAAIRRMVERRVDGCAVLTFGMEERVLIDDSVLGHVPLVFVDAGPLACRASNIRIDYRQGIREAVQHLAALRHRRIAFISGPLSLKSAAARMDAFEVSMQEIGCDIDRRMVIEGDHSIDCGIKAASTLLALAEPPTAVLCSNDMTAFGVLHACQKIDVDVPKSLSVVGYDDIPLARFMVPPLTTVRMSQSELATLAFEALLKGIPAEDRARSRFEYVLKTNLVIRSSTALLDQQRAASSRHIRTRSRCD